MTAQINRVSTRHDEKMLYHIIERAKTQYTCKRGPRPSGALFVSRLYSVGNQPERYTMYGDVKPTDGSPTCVEAGCMIEDGHCVRNNHAEVNALLQCAKYGIPTDGGIMYSINKPCYACTRACIDAGIVKIIYAYTVYDEDRTRHILEAAGVECVHVEL